VLKLGLVELLLGEIAANPVVVALSLASGVEPSVFVAGDHGTVSLEDDTAPKEELSLALQLTMTIMMLIMTESSSSLETN
jgi:hypothetical protein